MLYKRRIEALRPLVPFATRDPDRIFLVNHGASSTSTYLDILASIHTIAFTDEELIVASLGFIDGHEN